MLGVINPQDVIIVSAVSARYTDDENDQRVAEAATFLLERDIPFKVVEGTFNGRLEKSFVVPGSGYRYHIRELARKYEQEVVLWIDEDRDAHFVDVDGDDCEPKLAGHWTGQRHKPTSGDYTYDPLLLTYFVIR